MSTRVQVLTNTDVIYEVCFWYNGNREIGTIKVEYVAMVEFYFKQEQIKVPENLLKSRDLTETYLNAQRIKEIGDVTINTYVEIRAGAGKKGGDGGGIILIDESGGVDTRHALDYRVCDHPGGCCLPAHTPQRLHGKAQLHLIYKCRYSCSGNPPPNVPYIIILRVF